MSTSVSIDLSELVGARKVAPMELAAMTLAMVRVIEEVIERQPEHVECMLLGAWEQVERRTRGIPAPGSSPDICLIAEYFRHAGDWAAIRRCLTEGGEQRQKRAGEFAELAERHLATARQEYAQQFGGSQS